MVGGRENMFCFPARQITGKRWRRNKTPIEGNGQFETDDVLVQAGIDPEAMGYLTGKERREILIKAGLNPKEYDF